MIFTWILEREYDDVDRIDLTQDSDQLSALVNAAMNFRVHTVLGSS
jgi:hypothetical protein